MPRVEPQVRATETYTESNFLRLHTAPDRDSHGVRIVTIEHLSYLARSAGHGGWRCETLVDGERMSKDDALFIAASYARQHDVPVIYACDAD